MVTEKRRMPGSADTTSLSGANASRSGTHRSRRCIRPASRGAITLGGPSCSATWRPGRLSAISFLGNMDVQRLLRAAAQATAPAPPVDWQGIAPWILSHQRQEPMRTWYGAGRARAS